MALRHFFRLLSPHWPFLLLFLLSLQQKLPFCRCSNPSRTLASFAAHGRVNQFLRVPKESGDGEWLVVGAVNRLYVLELANLSVVHEAVTGPILDSPFCNAELSSCVGPRDGIAETDTWNKIVQPLNASSHFADALLICGSTRQGECQLRQLPSLERLQRHAAIAGTWQHIPVAANAPDASTAALLVAERLFVGAQSAHANSPYREAFPAVTTRLLADGLQPARVGSLDGEAAVYVRAEFRARLPIRYLLVFRDSHFVYWLVVQPVSAQSGSPLTTRLVRVCLEDDRYTSYSELELQCRAPDDNALFGVASAGAILGGGAALFDQRDDDGILYAAFSDAAGTRSALCAFPLPKLRLTFWYNIDRCRTGTDTFGMPHIGRDAKCANRSHLPLSDHSCLLGVGGSLEAAAPAIRVFDRGTVITAIGTARVDGHGLVTLGTARGELIQMEVPSSDQKGGIARTYAEFRAAADPIDQIGILEDGTGILIVAEKEVLLISLSLCGFSSPTSASCSDCLAGGDPLCAWCLPLGRCTRPQQCPTTDGSLRDCPSAFGTPRPENVSLSTATRPRILLSVRGLPNLPPDFAVECTFGAAFAFRTRAQQHADGFWCPLASEMPRIAPGEDHLEMPVALRVSGTRVNLVEPPAKIKLYSCDTYQLCSTCSSSKWPCRWCATERKCVDAEDVKRKCRNERRKGPSSACIRILPPPLGSELFIPDSTNASLQLQLDNMPSSNELLLACRFVPNSNQVRVARVAQRNTVNCEPGMFSFEESEAMKNVTVELLADGEPVDATKVTIFKCPLLASDCSRCVALDPRFACTWCDGSCKHSTKCVVRDADGGAAEADELCTTPAIREFSPRSGPLEGGTVVDIVGHDLGSRLQDVQDRVQVAGVPCRVLHYELSVRILCVTERSPLPFRAPIRLTIGRSARRNAQSAEHFEFRSPQVLSAQPTFGPQSGGTRLQLIGTNLDVGRNASVYLDNLECSLQEKRESDRVICLTAASPRAYTVTAIRLQIDGAVRLLPAKFEYRTDPEVRDVQPRTAYESGGRKLIVTGSHLDSVLSPKLFLLSAPTVPSASPDELELISELGACHPLNSSALSCDSPSLALPTALLRQSSMARWMVGMAMDGVRTVRNLGPIIQLTTVPDPQFSPFAGLHILQAEQPLMLSGQWLSQAATPAEYSVTIGTALCPVFLLEPDRLLCRPPTVPPLPTDDSGSEMPDGRPLVVVHIGRVRVEIGPLEYAGGAISAGISRIDWSRRAGVLGLAVLLVIVIVVLVAVGLAWRRRQGEHERTYRRIQLQMEQMESQVRSECKQAFAELQTDVLAELDGVDDGAGIPFLESRESVARLLLRDFGEPTINGAYGGAIYSSQLPMTLAQFESLLWNRQFIYVLVQMAEEEPTISASERASLASLLLAVLSRNLAFASDVVLSLLSAHVQRCSLMHSPHLLFRHSDSLVEKLFQQWLALCLLPHLRDSEGPARSLFLLYRALKSLTEKGPVDAVTGQARYSLSEQSLLRESVEARPLTVLVIPLDGFDQAPVPIRTLDCDTISQLKAKLLDTLYRNVPYSTRVGIDQFDLEWRCPRRGSVLLLDDDQPQRSGGLRQLNTLAHYAVSDQALLAMQARAGSVPHAHAAYTFRSGGSNSSDQSTVFGWRSTSANHLLSSSSDSSAGSGASPHSSSGTDPTVHFHLQQPSGIAGGGTSNSARPSRDRRSATMLSEVFLTRLLMCKGTAQRFVDTFFESVLFTEQQQNIPVVLKYVFDFLDSEAAHCPQPIDSDVLHAWKANCLVLRFWQQFLHCPDLLFDVPPRPASLAGSLAVVGQTLVEAFSRADLDLSSASPSSRLLFARDIARFRPRAEDLFRWIAAQPPISAQHFFDYVGTLSKVSADGVSSTFALGELLNWTKANGLRLIAALEADAEARRARLAERLRQIVQSTLMEGAEEHVYATLR